MRFSSSKCTKTRFRPGLRPVPRWGAYEGPPDLLVGWGGGIHFHSPSPRRLRRLNLGAFRVSILDASGASIDNTATSFSIKSSTERHVLVVSVALLVARRTSNRKVASSIPANAVCFTV